jgi:hypothetical protein
MVYGYAFFNELYDKSDCENLPSVKDDEKKVDSLFKLMQTKEENIHKFRDVTYDEIKAF